MTADLEIVDGLAQFLFNAAHGDPWHIDLFKSASVNLDNPTSWGEFANLVQEQRPALLSHHMLVPSGVQLDSGVFVASPDEYKVVRECDNKVLGGVVSNRFHLGQPIDMLDALRNLVFELNGEPSTIGLLGEGTTFFASAKVKDFSLDLGDGDTVDHYVNVVSGLTGSRSRGYMVSGIRPVCANTVSAAWASASDENSRKVRNTANTFAQRDDAAQHDMRQILAAVAHAGDRIARMVQTRGSADDIATISKAVFGDTKQGQRITSEIEQLYTTAPGQELATCQDTLWGVHNAFTFWTDHCSRVGGARKGALADLEVDSATPESVDRLISHRLWGKGAEHRTAMDVQIDALLNDRAPIVAQSPGL